MKKILIMSLKNPWRKNKIGGSQDILGRIIALSYLGYTVDVIAIDDEDQLQVPSNLPENVNLFLYKKRTNLKNSLKYPIASANRYKKEICYFLSEREYDIAFAESEFMLPFWTNKNVKSKKNYLRMHNIESEYYLELAKTERSYLKKVLFTFDSKRLNKIEKSLNDYFEKLLFISESEKEKFAKKYGEDTVEFLPASVPISTAGLLPNVESSNNGFLAFGDFTLDINKSGLLWFLKNVWPLIVKENKVIRLKIVGNGAEAFKDFKSDQIEVLGYVEDLKAVFNEVQTIIIPLLEGAGVKIKLVESLLMNKTIITTSKGIEGTDLKDNIHLLVADNDEEFAQKCIDVFHDNDMSKVIAKEGFVFAKELFSIEGQMNYIEKIIGAE
ncbi:glycosyltransferase family 4 protein [Bacillus sp. B1-b2]|uniref:glycosyltransferase family 4 protein n=1 Tax=Bacillus sp. B1-b2 TaxID=2653201 RepID=UPI0012626065|nr:glycosyltransferase family 4 protein [Bacillus sp. B1-b2]KAB7668457.1 glycosyltransferase family 4 protein [Bacillus sp. B1-b2]